MADKISEARLQQLIEMGNEISPPPAVLDIVKALRELSELRLLLEEVERLTARIETLEKALREIKSDCVARDDDDGFVWYTAAAVLSSGTSGWCQPK